jgi:hypothetical protein
MKKLLLSLREKIWGPYIAHNNNEWSYELYALYEDMNIITFIKVGRSKLAGHIVRLDQQRPAKRILNAKPEVKEESLN